MKNRLRLLLLAVVLLALPAGAATVLVTVSDAQGKALADAVVFAEPVSGKAPKGRLLASIDQINKQFTPYVSIVQTGTSLSLPNRDNIRHHVYSFSAARTFDIKLYSGVPAAPVLFDKPGLVILGCNIHDWMLAYLYVVDTPWFAVSDSSGRAMVTELPMGSYTLSATHPLAVGEPHKHALQILANGTSTVALRLTLTAAPASNPAAR